MEAICLQAALLGENRHTWASAYCCELLSWLWRNLNPGKSAALSSVGCILVIEREGGVCHSTNSSCYYALLSE